MDGWLRIGTKIETKNFDSQIEHVENQIEELEVKLNQADTGVEVGDVTQIEVQYEKLKNQLIDLRKKQEDLDKADLKNLEKTMDSIGNKTSKTIKKVSKWVMAIFSLRSAYMAIRGAMSILTQYNDDLARKIESIKLVFASALEPLITKIVNLVYNLLGLINSVAKAWFNIDLFASASEMSIKNSAKSAEKMKKSLAGFDEMNVITDVSSSGNNPTKIDFSDVGNTDLSGIYGITDKIKEIFNNVFIKIKENIINVMLDLGFSSRFISMWELMVEGIKFLIDGLLDFIGGILNIIVGLVTGDTEKVKEGISKLINGILEMLAGLLSFVVGIFGMIVSVIIDTFLVAVKWIYDKVIKPIGDWFANLWDGIVNGVTTAVNKVKSIFNTVVTFFRSIISTIVTLFKNIGTKVGDVIGSAFKAVINGILSAIENILNFPIKSINKLLDIINKVPGINITKLSTFNLPRLKSGGIINQPGRGVPLGIGGEAGKEGVIPLTDSQAMEELGSAIGRYITINATLINQMNGRTISRELKKVQNESAFATNR